jgi:hypothetical protein
MWLEPLYWCGVETMGLKEVNLIEIWTLSYWESKNKPTKPRAWPCGDAGMGKSKWHKIDKMNSEIKSLEVSRIMRLNEGDIQGRFPRGRKDFTEGTAVFSLGA